MSSKVPSGFVRAFYNIWSISINSSWNIIMSSYNMRAFIRYINIYCYAKIHGNLSHSNLIIGLKRLGVPCLVDKNSPFHSKNKETSVEVCYESLMQRSTTTRYLCPLDCSGILPNISFYNSKIKNLSEDDLKCILINDLARQLTEDEEVNLERLSFFQWLEIEVVSKLPPLFIDRYMPFLSIPLDDMNAIDPYKSQYPEEVEIALFMFLLLPWEEWLNEPDGEWRPFNIPWMHATSRDVFKNSYLIPSYRTLTWNYEIVTDRCGEEHQIELPYERYCTVTEHDMYKYLSPRSLNNFNVAIKNGLINIAARHQFLKSFNSSGFDAFLSHIVVIDACMGETVLERESIESKNLKKLQATGRLKYRLVGLLGKKSIEHDMDFFYELRSNYVHGNHIGKVKSSYIISLRKLVTEMLLEILNLVSNNSELTRMEFLKITLDKGYEIINEKK